VGRERQWEGRYKEFMDPVKSKIWDVTFNRRGCERVGAIPAPPFCICVGMIWGDFYLYLRVADGVDTAT